MRAQEWKYGKIVRMEVSNSQRHASENELTRMDRVFAVRQHYVKLRRNQRIPQRVASRIQTQVPNGQRNNQRIQPKTLHSAGVKGKRHGRHRI